jgi:hypothetical protein
MKSKAKLKSVPFLKLKQNKTESNKRIRIKTRIIKTIFKVLTEDKKENLNNRYGSGTSVVLYLYVPASYKIIIVY